MSWLEGSSVINQQPGGIEGVPLGRPGRPNEVRGTRGLAETLLTFMVNDLPDPVRFSKVVGDLLVRATKTAKGEHLRIAACGESAPFLWAQGKGEAAVRLEHSGTHGEATM